MSASPIDRGPERVTQVRELILASAGSGKTFRISSRIIGLLARGEAVASIFASTFTRKAAGEILDRVLLRLAEAATSPSAARALAGFALAEQAPDDAATTAFWTPSSCAPPEGSRTIWASRPVGASPMSPPRTGSGARPSPRSCGPWTGPRS